MKTLKLTALTLVVAVASVLFVQQLLGQSSSPIPLTIERTEQAFGDPGVNETRVIDAVRADGSTVRATQGRRPDGTLIEIRNIFDLAIGRRIVLASGAKSSTTYRYAPQQLRGLGERRISCSGDRTRDPILGYDVVTMSRDLPAFPGENPIRLVTRYAPALGCLVLDQTAKQVQADGSERLIQQSQVVRIELGDPDPALFLVPADYTEVSPTEYARSVGSVDNPIIQQLEMNYRTNQAEYGL